MPNRLAGQISPYLLQHADNPVDWYPWGPEAIQRARAQQRPIFLSIGYSACHWCHVMAHESFEDPKIAQLLNEHFISVKVDREVRPDLDQVYMEAVQILAGQGGWPLSVFLTPELEPFFGGTYWPPRARGGMPGFDQVLLAVIDAWNERREEVVQQAGRLTEVLRDSDGIEIHARGKLNVELFQGTEAALSKSFDPQNGGFGRAPKFPHPLDLRVLLRLYRRTGTRRLLDMVTTTLDRMSAGGIYDHLGGGFHRYSTDAQWLAPHFEKMLYDNAMLTVAYLEAWQVTHRGQYARVARETLQYVLRDMTDPQGGFWSTEDADSEGEEGRYYLWTPDEIRAVLGPERARTFCSVYDVSDAGNFQRRNILHLAQPIPECAKSLNRNLDELEAELADSRQKLLVARSGRVRPGQDDKIVASTSGLMIEAMAQAGMVLGESRYVQAAAAAAQFLVDTLRSGDGKLLHAWRRGRAQGEALLDDHAALANGLITLYEACFDERWIDEAVRLADQILQRFGDPQGAGFFLVPCDSEEPLIARKKDMLDSSTPSGGGLAAMALVRLGKLCGCDDYLRAAEAVLEASVSLIEKAPIGTGQLQLALDMQLGPTPEIVLLADGGRAVSENLLAELHRRFVPNKIVACRDTSAGAEGRSQALAGIFEGKQAIPPGPTLFVCERFGCREPVSGPEAALIAIASLAAEEH